MLTLNGKEDIIARLMDGSVVDLREEDISDIVATVALRYGMDVIVEKMFNKVMDAEQYIAHVAYIEEQFDDLWENDFIGDLWE